MRRQRFLRDDVRGGKHGDRLAELDVERDRREFVGSFCEDPWLIVTVGGAVSMVTVAEPAEATLFCPLVLTPSLPVPASTDITTVPSLDWCRSP